MGKVKLQPPASMKNSESQYYILDLLDKSNLVEFYTPEAIRDKPSNPQYAVSSIVGRGNQFVTYTQSDNRTVDFTVVFMDDYTELPLTTIKNRLTAMQTPSYSGGQVIPPEVQVRLGAIAIRGVLENLSFNSDGPIRNGMPIRLTVDFSITETRKVPLGKSEVIKKGIQREW